MLDYATIGKSGCARVLVSILNEINKPKVTRKVISYLNDNFRSVNDILQIPDTKTRLNALSRYNLYVRRVSRPDNSLQFGNLPPYIDPYNRELDTTKEILDRMFALIYEKLRDSMHATQQLIKDGVKYVDERWQPMETAPRDGNPILLFTKTYGIVEAWFAQGEWHENHEGREYSGSFWICADDKFQIEVEEWPYRGEQNRYDDGEAKAWMRKPVDPVFPEMVADTL